MKYTEKYGFSLDNAQIAERLQAIASSLDDFQTPEVLKHCFSLMDLTTLKANDTEASVTKFVEKVGRLSQEWPAYPLPASICVFSNFTSLVCEKRCSDKLHVTSVASYFPSAQTFLEVKVLECRLAVRSGADEIDILLPLNSFLAGDSQKAFDEISAMRKAIDEEAAQAGRKVILKVILETGLLVSEENIAEASFLAMEAGADFIKTSTGKVEINATPAAAFIMCECVRLYNQATGRKVGFKAAGGISTAKDALCYYAIVNTVLGKEWLNKDYFRFGVSRLGNALMSAIEQKTVTFF